MKNDIDSRASTNDEPMLFLVPDPTSTHKDRPVLLIQYPDPHDPEEHSMSVGLKPEAVRICNVMDFHWDVVAPAVVWSDARNSLYVAFPTETARAGFLQRLPERDPLQINLLRDVRASCFLRWPGDENEPCEIYRTDGQKVIVMNKRLGRDAFVIMGPDPALLPLCVPYEHINGLIRRNNTVWIINPKDTGDHLLALVCRNAKVAAGLQRSLGAQASRVVRLGQEVSGVRGIVDETGQRYRALVSHAGKWALNTLDGKLITTVNDNAAEINDEH